MQEVEKRQEELRSSCTELHKEINARRQEAKALREDLESMARQQRSTAKQLEALHEDEQHLQVSCCSSAARRSSLRRCARTNSIYR